MQVDFHFLPVQGKGKEGKGMEREISGFKLYIWHSHIAQKEVHIILLYEVLLQRRFAHRRALEQHIATGSTHRRSSLPSAVSSSVPADEFLRRHHSREKTKKPTDRQRKQASRWAAAGACAWRLRVPLEQNKMKTSEKTRAVQQVAPL